MDGSKANYIHFSQALPSSILLTLTLSLILSRLLALSFTFTPSISLSHTLSRSHHSTLPSPHLLRSSPSEIRKIHWDQAEKQAPTLVWNQC